jgi:hypothetical protein
MKALPYKEGGIFSVPLGARVDCLGVIARAPRKGGLVLAYFFERTSVAALSPRTAVDVAKVGNLYLMEGRWSVVAEVPNWRKETWPVPLLRRREPLSGRVYLVRYDDELHAVDECQVEHDAGNYPEDVVWGARAAEAKLRHLLNVGR